ncbi:MAG: hypothetical protein R3Y33_07065 [Clostridia bacterium]
MTTKKKIAISIISIIAITYIVLFFVFQANLIYSGVGIILIISYVIRKKSKKTKNEEFITNIYTVGVNSLNSTNENRKEISQGLDLNTMIVGGAVYFLIRAFLV